MKKKILLLGAGLIIACSMLVYAVAPDPATKPAQSQACDKPCDGNSVCVPSGDGGCICVPKGQAANAAKIAERRCPNTPDCVCE